MTQEQARQLTPGESYVRFAGGKYKVADLSERFGAMFIGIYDEPPSLHIDYLNANNVEWLDSSHPEQGEHPESICQSCGGENPVWSADNKLFNKVNGSPNGIICPTCFVKKANRMGINLFGIKPAEQAEQGYRANFLWGFPDDSIEAIGYEFANAKTEEYQKECWGSLVGKLSSPPPEGQDERPQIVCLCGSTRFMDAFQAANLKLTMEGKIVLSVGCNTKSDSDLFGEMPEGELADLKNRLDELHKRKIDLADEVFVLNVGGYIGKSTRSEIDYAAEHNKPVKYLEPISTYS